MKLIETVGLSRSGHHAVLNWVISNLVGFQIEWKYKMTYLTGTNVYVLDEANHDIPLGYHFIEKFIEKIGTLIVSYEDAPSDYTIFREDKVFQGKLSLNYKQNYNIEYVNRFLVIRDFYDNLISRLKANEKKIGKEWESGKEFIFKTDELYIERWKNLARHCVENKISYIKFEDWLESDNIKEKFLYDVFGIKQIRSSESIKGTISSFDKNNHSKKNYDLNIIPENIKDLIIKDNELHYLIGKLDYQYKKI